MSHVLPPVLLHSLQGAFAGLALAVVGAAAPGDDLVKLPTQVVTGINLSQIRSP